MPNDVADLIPFSQHLYTIASRLRDDLKLLEIAMSAVGVIIHSLVEAVAGGADQRYTLSLLPQKLPVLTSSRIQKGLEVSVWLLILAGTLQLARQKRIAAPADEPDISPKQTEHV